MSQFVVLFLWGRLNQPTPMMLGCSLASLDPNFTTIGFLVPLLTFGNWTLISDLPYLSQVPPNCPRKHLIPISKIIRRCPHHFLQCILPTPRSESYLFCA